MPDSSGQIVNNVPVPITGYTAWAPKGTSLPSTANMASAAYTLPTAYVRLGARTTDGAPDWSENTASMIELYESGLKVNPGTGIVQVTQKFAQFDDVLRGAVRGVAPVSGVLDVDIDASVEGVLFTEDTYLMPDGTFKLWRHCAPAKITSVKPDKPQRGQLGGVAVTWDVDRSTALANKHYREAWVVADSTPDPAIWSIAPAGLTVAGVMVVHGINFTGMSAATIGGTTVTVKSVADDATVLLTIPAGVAAGAKDVIITTPSGASAAFSYVVA